MKNPIQNAFLLLFLGGYVGMVYFAITYVKHINELATYNPTMFFAGMDIAILFIVGLVAINVNKKITEKLLQKSKISS